MPGGAEQGRVAAGTGRRLIDSLLGLLTRPSRTLLPAPLVEDLSERRATFCRDQLHTGTGHRLLPGTTNLDDERGSASEGDLDPLWAR